MNHFIEELDDEPDHTKDANHYTDDDPHIG